MNKKILITLMFLSIIFGCAKDDIIADDDNQNGAIVKTLNRQTTGSSANNLLSDNTFNSMIIELVYVEGFEPTQTAIDNLISFLNDRTYKPNGIAVEKREIPSPGNETYTIEEIADIERAERKNYNTSGRIAVWAFFVDGKSANDTDDSVVLGTAYWNTSFVIYENTVQNLSNSTFEPRRDLLETTVITHEFAHLLGLTNLGTPLQSAHEDSEHPKHCDVDTCLMYWASETGAGVSNMINMDSAPELDAQCIADLQANGGK